MVMVELVSIESINLVEDIVALFIIRESILLSIIRDIMERKESEYSDFIRIENSLLLLI